MNYCDNGTFPIGRKFRPFYMKDTITGERKTDTLFEVSYDDTFLYFRFVCEEKFFYPRHTAYNAPLYDGDIVELMISLADKNHYLEVEVNQNGAEYCVLVENPDGENFTKLTPLPESVVKSTVKLEKDKWECVILISMETLRGLGWKAGDCYFNAHRQDWDEKGNLTQNSLSTIKSTTFHKINAFAKMMFE